MLTTKREKEKWESELTFLKDKMEKESQMKVICLASERYQGNFDKGEFTMVLGMTLSFQSPEILTHIFLH